MKKQLVALMSAVVLLFALTASPAMALNGDALILDENLSLECDPDEVLIHGFNMTPESRAEFDAFIARTKISAHNGISEDFGTATEYTEGRGVALTPTSSIDVSSIYRSDEGFSTYNVVPIDEIDPIKGPTPDYVGSDEKGAHYYAFSKRGDLYSAAYTKVKLPTSIGTRYNSSTGKSLRHAFISLGIMGPWHGVDIGIMNDGTGWFPYYNDVADNNHFKMFNAADQVAPSGTVYAVINAAIIDKITMQMSVQYQDASGAPLRNFWYQFGIKDGTFEYGVNQRIYCSIYRFASLVQMPGAVDDRNDGTFMTAGMFTGSQVYDYTGKYNLWGMFSDTMEKAWAVWKSRIYINHPAETDKTNCTETFSIHHSANPWWS